MARDNLLDQPIETEAQALSNGVLDGRYVLEHELGRGGMGRVFSGRDLKLSRAVAIKILPQGFQRGGAAARFAREARAVSSFSHPNVLSVFDAGASGEKPYLVTELLVGETLRRRLDNAKISLPDALRFGLSIARGVAAAHDHGIIHRDLKPDNIFIVKGDWIKILDFGISKFLGEAVDQTASEVSDAEASHAEELTARGAFLGTVGYAAPEQIRGHPVDARTDLFAFGVLLHEMISGERTFRRGTKELTALAVLNEPAPVLQRAPESVRLLIERCLEKDPSRRPSTAHEVEKAIEQTLSELRISSPDRETPAVKSRLRMFVVICLALVGLVTGIWSLTKKNVSSTTPLEHRIEELAKHGTGSAPALRAFLEGEAALRVGDRWTALQSFRTAVEKDPQFGLAHFRVATTARGAEPGLARDAIAKAFKSASPLEERERRLMRAQDAADRGEVNTAISFYRDAIAARADDVEALRDLGDLLFTFGPIHGWPIDDAADAERRALVLDPFDVDALRSLINVAQMQAQPEIVRALTDRFATQQSTPPLDILWVRAWSAGDFVAREQVIRDAVACGKLDVQMKVFLRAGFSDPMLADATNLARQLSQSGQRAFWLSALAVTALGRGKPSSARNWLAEAMQISNGGSLPHFAAWMETLDFLHPTDAQLRIARVAATVMDEVRIPDYKPTRLYLDGSLAVRLRDYEAAERAAAALNDLPSPDGTTVAHDLALGVRALSKAAQGKSEEALSILQRQQLRISDRDANFFSRISEQRLRATLNAPAEAMKWEVLTFDTPLEIPLAPAVHAHLCELSLRTGDRAGAAAHARFALTAWEEAEPELSVEVGRVRRCLADAGAR